MNSDSGSFQSTSMANDVGVYQDILLENVEDGACIQLCGMETRVTTNTKTEIECSPSASNKVTFRNITKFEWDHQYYQGNLISVTDKFMAYSLKGRVSNSVRVINCQNTSDRILLKGFTGVITDVAFSHATSNLLAAVDDSGNFLIWELFEVNQKIEAKLKLHLLGDFEASDTLATHRIVWIPHIQNGGGDDGSSGAGADGEQMDFGVGGIMTLFYRDVAEVWDINFACDLAEDLGGKVVRSQISKAYMTVKNDEGGVITDCELSPFGNVLAIASADGYVKFWQVHIESHEQQVCLHQWQPHDGRPLSAVRFCDDVDQDEPRVYWRFLLTACDKNTELKMWCAVTWKCLQIIKFQTPNPDLPLPEMNLVFLSAANFLVLTDIHRKVLYVMQIKASMKTETSSIVSLSHYTMTFPILSSAFVGVEKNKFSSTTSSGESPSKSSTVTDYFNYSDDSKAEDYTTDSNEQINGFLVKLLTIQRRSLQSLDIRYITDDLPLNVSDKSKDQDNSALSSIVNSEKNSALENGFSEAPTAESTTMEKPSSESAGSYLGAGDGITSPTKPLSQTNHEQTDTEYRLRLASQEKAPHPAYVSTPNDPISRDAVSTTTSHPTTPILLTPDAFLGSSKNSSRHSEAADSSNTPRSSLKTEENTSSSMKEEAKDPLSVLFAKPTGEEMSLKPHVTTKAPPSSPALRADEVQPASIDVNELLQSIRSKAAAIKSPDLISSASVPDDVKQEIPPPSTISAPPGLSRPTNSESPFSGISSPNIFSSLLVTTSASGTWPKAPDVTVSHLLPVSNSLTQPAFITPVAISSSGNVPSVAPSNLTHPNTQTNKLYDSVYESFTEFQRQQEEIMKSQRQILDSITKKQVQLQKQFETSQKRFDQHGDRLDMAISSLTEQQLKLGSDVRSSRSTMSEGVASKIDQAVKAEIKRTILPGVTSSIDEIRDKLSSTVAQQLSATDSVLKDTVGKSVKSKEMVDKIAVEMSKVLQERIQAMLPDIFLRTIVPAFERLCQSMFQQLATTYFKGMDENLKQVEKQMQFRLKTEYDKLQQVTKEASDTVRHLQNATKQSQSDYRNMQQQFSKNTDDLLKKFEDRISNRILKSMKQNDKEQSEQQKVIVAAVENAVSRILDEKLSSNALPNVTPTSIAGVQLGTSSLLRHTSVASQQEQILKLLQLGDVNKAFQIALNASDLNLVMYACETADPSMIFNVHPCPLTQPILLSLIQQLSCELASKTEIKLKYLQEAVMNLDRTHQVTKEYMHSVLGTLVQNLTSAALEPNQPLAKQLRMLSMAAQSLMG